MLIPFCEEMFAVKLIDLGNACYFNKRFSSLIQTRQYRAPEILVRCGRDKYTELVDEFSVACVIFEMLTGNYLFNPTGSTEQEKDENHLLLMVQVLGDDQLEAVFNLAKPEIQRSWFVRLNNKWKLKKSPNVVVQRIGALLVNKYNYVEEEAAAIEKFLEPMLFLDPKRRRSCAELLQDVWLNDLGYGDYLMQYGGRKQI